MEQVATHNTQTTTTKVGAIELVLFKFKAGVAEADGVKAMESLNGFVSQQKGFISRKFSKKEDGSWVDLVFWQTMEDARKASELVMQSPLCVEAFKVIDDANMQFMHATPVLEFDA